MRGQATAEADYGFLRADSNATASGINDPGGAFVATAYADASWTNTLTIPGPPSFSVSTMTVNISVAGNLSASDGGLEPGISSDAYSDFGNTITWGGITEVRDSLGVVVPVFTVTSASGVDYAQPVPEPATAGVIAALVELRVFHRAQHDVRLLASSSATD